MRINLARSARTAGSVLLVTLCTAIIIGIALASYLIMVQTQSKSVARSQKWNNTMIVNEAGIEDALELVNKYVGTPNLPNWTNTYALDGWSQSGNVYYVKRYIDANTYYEVWVTNVYDPVRLESLPAISSVAYVPLQSAQAVPQNFFAAVGATANGMISRKVDIQTQRDPLFNFAMAALKQIDLKGNNVETDSFDSSDPNYSTGGLYDPTKIKDGGDVVTDGTVTNTLSVGNASIKGHVKTGPGGTVGIQNGSVGSIAWVDANTQGIQPGYSSSDMNVAFPDVQYPNYVYNNPTWLTTLPAGGTVNNQSYNHVITSSGFYQLSGNNFSGNIYVGTNANVVLWVTSSVNNFNNLVTIAPEGASLTIYLASSFSEAGNGNFNNLSQKAQNLYLLGLPTCTSISLGGNGSFTGVIYAPEASLTLGGGGSTIYDLVGSCMARNITLNGHWHFHYDEALRNRAFARGYIPSNWKESTL